MLSIVSPTVTFHPYNWGSFVFCQEWNCLEVTGISFQEQDSDFDCCLVIWYHSWWVKSVELVTLCWISFIFQGGLRTIDVMLSTARHTAELSESSGACAFKRKHFSQLISTSHTYCKVTAWNINLRSFFIYIKVRIVSSYSLIRRLNIFWYFLKLEWSIIPSRNATNLAILCNKCFSFACDPV